MYKIKFFQTLYAKDKVQDVAGNTFTYTSEIPFPPYKGLNIEITGIPFKVEGVSYVLEDNQFYCYLSKTEMNEHTLKNHIKRLKENLWENLCSKDNEDKLSPGNIWKWVGEGESFRVRIDELYLCEQGTEIAFTWTNPTLAEKLVQSNKGRWKQKAFMKCFEWIGRERVIHSNEEIKKKGLNKCLQEKYL